MSDTLFDLGDPAPAPAEKLSATQRLTLRRNAMLAAGWHPTTKVPLRKEPGMTCADCAHVFRRQLGGTYWKCGAVVLTGGPASDVRLSWPACQRWEPKP